jgi:hypothetical protein
VRAVVVRVTDLVRGLPSGDESWYERRFCRLDETAREVSERQVLPSEACARDSSSSGRQRPYTEHTRFFSV